MKTIYKTIPLMFLAAFGFSSLCHADMADTEKGIGTKFDVWLGFSLDEDSGKPTAGYADSFPTNVANVYDTNSRTGTTKAYEWEDLDRSFAGGLLFNTMSLPQRVHVETDIYSDRNWFGDVRYSYEDYFVARLLPRRFVHHLDNINYIDLDTTDTSDITVEDFGQAYDLTIDIDTYKLRLKTPNFPWHFYSQYEQVNREGARQYRFLGGDGHRGGGQDKNTKKRNVDQDTKEVTFGTNAHLRWVEVDLSHTDQTFSSKDPFAQYSYLAGQGKTAGVYRQNVLPELKASTNTLKVHTSQTGRIVASATVSRVDRKNENSDTTAQNTLGQGEVFWSPMEKLSLAARYRYQDNEATSPGFTTLINYTDATQYAYTGIRKGVESTSHAAYLIARYRLFKNLLLKGQYTHRMKDNDTQSANDWSRPDEISSNIFEAGISWKALRDLKINAKVSHTSTDYDWTALQDAGTNNKINKDPEKINQGKLTATWTPNYRFSAMIDCLLAKEKTDENHIGDEEGDGESMNQRYLASLNYMLSETLSLTGGYTYMSIENEGLMVWEEGGGPPGGGTEYIDHGYKDEQVAHNFNLGFMALPMEDLTVNAMAEYIIGEGDYTTTQIKSQVGGTPFYIGDFLKTRTKELTYRLDGEYYLGNGLSTGLEMQFTDWEDESFENPAEGTYAAALFKVSKTF